jgi:hypothetical protein
MDRPALQETGIAAARRAKAKEGHVFLLFIRYCELQEKKDS